MRVNKNLPPDPLAKDICDELKKELEQQGYVVYAKQRYVRIYKDDWKEKGVYNIFYEYENGHFSLFCRRAPQQVLQSLANDANVSKILSTKNGIFGKKYTAEIDMHDMQVATIAKIIKQHIDATYRTVDALITIK